MTLSRKLILLPVAAATVFALVGCGRSEAPAANTATTVDTSPATGTIELWGPGADAESLPELLAGFEDANPEVTVNITSVPEDSFDTKMTAAIASGTVPDLIYMPTQSQPALLETGGFAAVPEGLVDGDDFFSSAWEGTLVDGTAHAVPWYTYAQVFYYRTDLAAAAGVSAPTTWDELITFADALQANGVAYPLTTSNGYNAYTAQEFLSYAARNGGGLISDDKTEWTIDTEENVGALEFWGSLIADGYSSPDSPTFLDNVPFFTSGQIATNTNGPWFPGWLDEANGADWTASNLGVVVPPAGPAGSFAMSAGGSLGVLEEAENPDAAWKLVQYLASPEVQAEWYTIFGNPPAVVSAWEDPVVAENPLLAPVGEALETAVPVPPVPTWGEVGDIIGAQMERVARGTATAHEALTAAQQQADAIGTGVE